MKVFTSTACAVPSAIQNAYTLVQVHGYFQGLSFPLASVAVVNAVYFGVYGDVLIRLQKAQADAGAVRLSRYANIFIAGCAAGLAQTVVAGPADMLKVVLQSQLNHNGIMRTCSLCTVHRAGA